MIRTFCRLVLNVFNTQDLCSTSLASSREKRIFRVTSQRRTTTTIRPVSSYSTRTVPVNPFTRECANVGLLFHHHLHIIRIPLEKFEHRRQNSFNIFLFFFFDYFAYYSVAMSTMILCIYSQGSMLLLLCCSGGTGGSIWISHSRSILFPHSYYRHDPTSPVEILSPV